MFKNNNLIFFRDLLPLVLLVALGGCDKPAPPPEEIRLVLTQKVVLGAHANHPGFAGEVRARSESALGFRVGGKITERLVDVGAAVKPGTLLARLDARDLQLNIANAKSQQAAAQADWAQAQADFARYNDLFQKKFISAAEFDRRKAVLDVAAARHEQMKAQSGVVENQGTYAELRADRAGVVTAVEAEAGQVVAAGQTVVRVAREAEKEILIAVPENRLTEVRGAQHVVVTLWAAPKSRYSGKVREISPAADPVTRTYAVRIAVAEADAVMQLGMTATVSLTQAEAQAVALLPLSSIYQKDKQPAVWVVEMAAGAGTGAAAGAVRLAPVSIGQFREDTVTVTSGVKEGDVVVTAGVHKLTPGQKVRVADTAAARK